MLCSSYYLKLTEIFIIYHRLIKMSLAMLVIPYLPACNVVVRVGFVVAERVLYLPSSGWCLLVSMGLSIIIKHNKVITISISIIHQFDAY